MISAIIIDDEPTARATLRSLLQAVYPALSIIDEADGVTSGLELLRGLRPDVLLLDVQLRDGTGFDLLDQLPDLDYHLIFVTAYEEFAIRAFRYHALDYLIKPIDPDELLAVCRKLEKERENKLTDHRLRLLLESLQSGQIENLALSTSEGMIYLKLKEIVRLESEGNYTFFHTDRREKVIVSRGLKEFEDILPSALFFRTHQSHIVNLREVRKVLREDGGYALMGDDAKVPIARRKKEDFLRRLEERSI